MRILFVSTWFPFPLSQGSKIRAYHLLHALARDHQVALVSFEDAPIQSAWMEHIKQLCTRIDIVHHSPFATNYLSRGLGWLSLQPSAVVGTHSADMAAQVRKTASELQPDRIVALTFVTAPYVLDLPVKVASRGGLVVDVDNFLTRMLYEAYQQSSSWSMRTRRWLAWWKFQRYERWLFKQFDLCLAASERDQNHLLEMLGRKSGVCVVPNGVDTAFNSFQYVSVISNTLIFNGALTYQANYDAMAFFSKEIFPLIQQQVPDVKLQITGKTEGVPLSNLRLNTHTIFTGYLEDIRPAIAQSCVCVVPLRIGAGTRLKILEAMALGTPVVSTSKGAEGIDVVNEEHLLLADSPADFARQTVRLLHDWELRKRLTTHARRLVEEKYDWQRIGRQFCCQVEALGQEGK